MRALLLLFICAALPFDLNGAPTPSPTPEAPNGHNRIFLSGYYRGTILSHPPSSYGMSFNSIPLTWGGRSYGGLVTAGDGSYYIAITVSRIGHHGVYQIAYTIDPWLGLYVSIKRPAAGLFGAWPELTGQSGDLVFDFADIVISKAPPAAPTPTPTPPAPGDSVVISGTFSGAEDEPEPPLVVGESLDRVGESLDRVPLALAGAVYSGTATAAGKPAIAITLQRENNGTYWLMFRVPSWNAYAITTSPGIFGAYPDIINRSSGGGVVVLNFTHLLVAPSASPSPSP